RTRGDISTTIFVDNTSIYRIVLQSAYTWQYPRDRKSDNDATPSTSRRSQSNPGENPILFQAATSVNANAEEEEEEEEDENIAGQTKDQSS
ncbi:hypothetical protein NDU88_005485, partial [Pleurodeles waltl]